MQPELQAAIEALWGDARPRLLARVEALQASSHGELAGSERERAAVEAHTLAGTLGAFGRAAASAAARDAERAIECSDREALAAAVRTLRAALEGSP